MLILSRIIIKEWFKSFIGAVVVLFMLISTADLINGFLQGKDSSRVLLEYLLKMPDLMSKMLGICCLVATLFSFNKLKAHSELISILASGYSYSHIYFLIGSCSLFVVSAQFMNLSYLEPYANKVKRQEIQKSRLNEGKYLTRSSLEGGKFWYKSQGYFASFAYFDRQKKSLKDFEIYFFSEQNTSVKIIRSDDAKFVGDNYWQLINATEYTNLDSSAFPMEQAKGNQTIRLGEGPEDFGEFEADLTTLNFFKLRQFISKLSKTGINIEEYQVILWNKIFLSLACLVFALLPLSTIFNPNRRSSSFGLNVVITLLTTVVFWVLYSSSVAFGNSGKLPPIIATGLVPSVFMLYVVWTFLKNRKLSI
jgi:lipopolysaccharide export system permease protein